MLSPASPSSASPQAQTVPSLLSARACTPPADMATTLVSPATRTGLVLIVVDPFPSWPAKLDPQVQTVPSLFNATLKPSPAAIALTPVTPVTWTGTELPVGVPSPSPEPFAPNTQTVPSLATPRQLFGGAFYAGNLEVFGGDLDGTGTSTASGEYFLPQ